MSCDLLSSLFHCHLTFSSSSDICKLVIFNLLISKPILPSDHYVVIYTATADQSLTKRFKLFLWIYWTVWKEVWLKYSLYSPQKYVCFWADRISKIAATAGLSLTNGPMEKCINVFSLKHLIYWIRYLYRSLDAPSQVFLNTN